MAEARVPITTTYSGQGFDQAQRDAAKLRRLQERHNRAVQSEFKQQIAQQKRLSALTKKLEREQAKAAREAERRTQARRRQMKEIGAAVATAGAALGTFAARSIQAAAEAERLERAGDAMGRQFGVTGLQIIRSIQEASDFTIGRLDAMQSANQLMLLGVIDSQEQFGELSRMAVVLGRAMGRDARQSIDDLATGLGRQSNLILDNLGITVDATVAYEKYAKQLGKTSSELTDAEKKQAFVNEAIEQGQRKVEELGGASLDTAGKIERIPVKWQELIIQLGQLGDAGGALDAIDATMDKLIEGAHAWNIVLSQHAPLLAAAEAQATELAAAEGDRAAKTRELNQEFMSSIPVIGEGLVYISDISRGWLTTLIGTEEQVSDLADAYVDVATAAEEAAATSLPTPGDVDPTSTEPEVDTEEDERLQRVADLRERAVRDILRIEDDAFQASEEAWRDYYTEIDELGREFAEDAKSARKDATKDLLKIEKDFAKGVKKLRSDLARDLERVNKDENRDISRLQERHAKETMRERRMRKIDALADERLFNFEIQQLAAEGEGNRIRELIARREIEQEIEAEKAEEAARQEDERLQEDIERVQEAAEERRAQLEEDHALRLNLLTEEAEEAKALRQQELAEKLAEETTNFQERLEQQKQFRVAKLAEIEKGKAEALAKVGEEMSQAKEITRTELESFKPVAKSMGEQIGANVAQGINQGIQQNLRVQSILNGIGSGAGSGRGFGGFMQSGGPFGLIPRFAEGGIVPGPVGAPRLIVAEGGETVLPTHKGGGPNITVQVNAPGGLATDRLAGFLEGKLNAGFQEFLDGVIVPALE